MTTYKDIKGTNIKVLSSDPPATTGQIWYNSTSETLKGYKLDVGSWSTSTDLPTGTFQLSGCGTQTAALAFGGGNPGASVTTNTYEYNGSTWTGTGALNLAIKLGAGCGTQTAGLSFGGATAGGGRTNQTEEYNGSSWAVTNGLNSPVEKNAGCGTQTAGLSIGGEMPFDARAEEYNGSTWAIGGTMTNGQKTRELGAAAGTQTACLLYTSPSPRDS